MNNHDAHQALADMASKQQLSRDELLKFGCRGTSCNQGRRACKERCGAEMACAGDEDSPATWRLRGIAVLAVVGFVAWVGYWLLPALT